MRKIFFFLALTLTVNTLFAQNGNDPAWPDNNKGDKTPCNCPAEEKLSHWGKPTPTVIVQPVNVDVTLNTHPADTVGLKTLTVVVPSTGNTSSTDHTGLVLGILGILALLLIWYLMFRHNFDDRPVGAAVNDFLQNESITLVGDNGGVVTHSIRTRRGTERMSIAMNAPSAHTVQLRTAGQQQR